jgi:hypothetical protein
MISSEVTTTKKEVRMKKVAINTCFGGFGLSDTAFERLLARKGIAFEKVKGESSFMGDTYYRAGHVGVDDHFLSDYSFYKDRADPDLIAVIEERGAEVNGFAADIRIVEVPADAKWHVHEYDGLEHVAENHRTWR